MGNFPVLKWGSAGEAVRLLQRALNAAPTALARLKEDAQFGPKTHARVAEFQGQHGLVRDGIAGPLTWAELEPFLKMLEGIADQVSQRAPQEDAVRERIVAVAETAFLTFGWGEAGIPEPDGSHRIIAAKGFGPAVNGRRARQGGAALASIYAMAGAGGEKCLTISTEMEKVYQQDPAAYPERRKRINQEDIGSWCGIFATYCLRTAGLRVSWNDVKTQSRRHFEWLAPQAAVKKGDIGVMDPAINHHFVVIADAAPGERVYSIDGNVGNPSENNRSPWNSVIGRRFYLRSTLTAKNGKFLRPKFGPV
jgi:hypothetical protein